MSSSDAEASAAPAPLPPWPVDGARSSMRVAGRPCARASARAKVTGRATYASDVALPRMLHAVVVRATVARGRVLRFDAGAALALPGVVAAFGPFDFDWPPFPRRARPVVDADVRFVGEEIGAIVATSEAAARHAARRVDVEYETRPACVTLDAALAGGGRLAGDVEVIERGDLDAASRRADVVVDAEYETQAQHHNPLEPHGCVAAWDGERLTLWDSNQGPHLVREWLAAALELPLDRVRVVSRFVGGGFGSKITLKPYHVIAAVLARRLGRPVRLFASRRDEFVASHQRAPTRRHIRVGATRDGRIAFIDERIAGQAGPCAFLARNAAGAANGLRLHRADAVRAELRRVLTNAQAPTPFRGPTVAEDLFCVEQAIDELAHALAMDPLELRLRNVAGVDALTGLPYAGNELERCYRLGAEAFGWVWRPPATEVRAGHARGIGIGAVAYDATLYESSRAEVACVASGRFEVRIGIAEIGCGADTVFAQVAAEELGVPLACVDTRFGDTDTTPRSIDSTNHSRTTAVVGPTVRTAAHALRERLLRAGARVLHVAPDDVVLDGNAVRSRHGAAHVALAEIVAEHGPFVEGAERERPPAGVFAAMFGAHFVEVDVDLHTGHVAVVRAVCAHDAGRVLNPALATSQVHGGFIQGIAMALHEAGIVDPATGRLLNATMWAYRTPGVLDAPGSIRFVDAGRHDGGNSLGVKGIGEPPLIAAGAAIANAIHNAIGIRMRSYPITPAKVLAALRERGR